MLRKINWLYTGIRGKSDLFYFIFYFFTFSIFSNPFVIFCLNDENSYSWFYFYFFQLAPKQKNQDQAEVILGTSNRRFMQADYGCFKNNKCKNHWSCSISNQEENLLCVEITSCSHRREIPFWDQDTSKVHWHPTPNYTNHRLFDAAWSTCWSRCRG